MSGTSPSQVPALTLSQQQQLQMILAPQLRQSLEMLQVPIMELRALIQHEIEQNPTLEEVPLGGEKIEIEQDRGDTDEDKKELDFEKEYEVLTRLDDEWREYFFQNIHSRPYTEEDEEKRQFLLNSIPQRESLQEHLLKQLRLSGLSEEDLRFGELIIGSINDDGYLTTSLQELADSVNCDVSRLEDILSVIQDFHPVGAGARDLRECLLIQIDRLGKGNSLAAEIVRNHLDKLAARKFPEIARALKVPIEEVQQAAKFIGTLDPKPGQAFSAELAAYVEPEVIVEKIDGEYVVILNDDNLPHIKISNHYRRLMNDENTPPDVKQYIRERIRSGAFLMKSIEQRQRTIHRIASEIVKKQRDFLEHGVSHLKPLTMAEIAREVNVHETTVSRAVSGKYMKTPIGTFEMKYFFTPGIQKADGTAVSNKAVKDLIAKMVAEEDPAKPLSDQEIMEKLREQGINIARRTIAKYRLVLRIPPSHLRRSF
ncbi:MAG: RNA polymerase factor sigma-54 [Kiritimatiellae bacterium]|nr:RNA polymerase factor sigma-54 [Kiritimatiellia bacterium]